MGIIIRQSFKGTIVSYIGALLGAFITIFIYPYFLSPDIIGLTRVLLDASLFFAAFSQFGLLGVITRYSASVRDAKMKNTIFVLISFLPLIGFLITCIIFSSFKSELIDFFKTKSPLITEYIWFIIPLAFFTMYLTIYEAYSAAYQRITVYKIVRDIFIRVSTVIAIVLFALLGLSTGSYIIMLISGFAIAAIVVGLYIKRVSKAGFSGFDLKTIPKQTYKQAGSFVVFLLIFGISLSLITRVDAIMISSLAGLNMAGIYAISFFIASMIEMPAKVTMQITAPLLSEALHNKDMAKVDDIYKRNTLNQGAVSGFIFLLIWINADALFAIMPNGEIYSAGKYVILFIGLAKLIDSVTGINNMILIYSRYYWYSAVWLIVLGAGTIGFNYLLIPKYGIAGAAISALISMFLFNFISILFIKIRLKTQPFSAKSVVVLSLIFFFFICDYFLPHIHGVISDAAIRSAVLSVLCLLIFCRTNLAPDIRQVIESFISVKDVMKFLKGK